MALSQLDEHSVVLVYESDADESGTNDVRHGPCTLYGMKITNTGGAAAAAWVRLYDATEITVGTTVPDVVIPVAADVSVFINFNPNTGLAFENGLSIACTSVDGDDDDTAPADTVTLELYTSV